MAYFTSLSAFTCISFRDNFPMFISSSRMVLYKDTHTHLSITRNGSIVKSFNFAHIFFAMSSGLIPIFNLVTSISRNQSICDSPIISAHTFGFNTLIIFTRGTFHTTARVSVRFRNCFAIDPIFVASTAMTALWVRFSTHFQIGDTGHILPRLARISM